MSNWNLQRSSVVGCSDASLSGWGLSIGRWPVPVVAHTGRVVERCRFRKRRARQRALGAAGVLRSTDSCVRYGDSESSGSSSSDESVVFGDPSVFLEVPCEYVRDMYWQSFGDGPWHRHEDIYVLELTSTFMLLRKMVEQL